MLKGAISMIFIDNKYTKWYFSIITSSKSRIPEPNLYYEKHHIIPKSLGGDNNKSNLTLLTAKEHFICHLLLVKMTAGHNQRKMSFASNMMLRGNNRYIPSGRIYQMIKEQFSKDIKLSNTGRKQTLESSIKKSLKTRGVKRKSFTEQHKENMSKCRIDIPTGRKGISISTKGKTYEEIHGIEKAKYLKDIRSKAWQGRKGFQKSGSDNPNAKCIIINGVNFNTKREACNFLNLTYYELCKITS